MEFFFLLDPNAFATVVMNTLHIYDKNIVMPNFKVINFSLQNDLTIVFEVGGG